MQSLLRFLVIIIAVIIVIANCTAVVDITIATVRVVDDTVHCSGLILSSDIIFISALLSRIIC